MHSPLIRVAKMRDNDPIIDLSLRAWRPVFESYKTVWGRPLYDRFYPDWTATQASDVANAINAHPTWVATVDETIVGFVNVTFNDQTLTGEIYMIAVDPGHQRRGLGSRLTRHALSEMRLRGMTLAIVSTGGDPGHGPARATYERSGFAPFPQMLYSMLLPTNSDEQAEMPGDATADRIGLGVEVPAEGNSAQGWRLERIDYSVIEESTYRSIRRVLTAAFEDDEDDEDDEESLHDFSDFDHWFVVVEDNEVIAVTGLLIRQILVGGKLIAVAGIGGVATDARHRSHRHASRLVDAAVRFAGELDLPFVLLQCVSNLVPFYTDRGWQEVPESLLCRQSDGQTYSSSELPMVISLGSTTWPPGLIDMNGLPW